jgi:hypothetical protein
LGSTRLANLSDEAQLARIRHVATAAALRARITGSDRRIPIRPNYQSTGRVPNVGALTAYSPDAAHLHIRQ